MPAVAARSQLLRQALTRDEWTRLLGFAAMVVFINGLGLTLLIVAVANGHTASGFGFGVGLTAWTLGLRHAFDADHISAIDNTTRKLLADGKRPLGVGFFFSLGHSTIVFGLSAAIAIAAKTVAGQVTQGSPLHSVGAYVGTGVSAFFLYLIAIVNLVILAGIYRIFREMRRGEYDEHGLEQKLQSRGLMNRLLGPLARSIKSSWQMYPVGLLFGLGFDTATEIGFLAIAGATAVGGLPWYAVLSLPLLFAGGMCLMDTADGAFMNVAYGWAFSNPVRKVFYNLAITGLSVAVALLIGTIELLQIMTGWLNLTGGFWDYVNTLSLNLMGYAIVGLFVATWVIALSVWKYCRIEERWALTPPPAQAEAAITARPAAQGYTRNRGSDEREGAA